MYVVTKLQHDYGWYINIYILHERELHANHVLQIYQGKSVGLHLRFAFFHFCTFSIFFPFTNHSYQLNMKIAGFHFASQKTWNNRVMIAETQSYIFRRSSCCARYHSCLRFLMVNSFIKFHSSLNTWLLVNYWSLIVDCFNKCCN